MPGLTLWLPAPGDRDAGARFRRAQQLLVRSAATRPVVDVERGACLIGHVSYPGYPVRTINGDGFTIVLEGHVYGRPDDQVDRELRDLFGAAFEAAEPVTAVTSYVESTDGDFLVVGVTSGGDRCIVFSDALGRLPVYVHEGSAGLVVAREAKFVASIRGAWAFDPLGLAQHLWLGYPLGERTLYEGIERGPAGLFVDARATGATGATIETRRATTYAYRCDRQTDTRDIATSAADIASRFAAATLARARAAGEAAVVVSASGGNDSRSVMAALAGASERTVAASFRRADGGQAADVAIAERVAAALGIHWEAIDLAPPRPDAEVALAWMKDGLNPVAMAFIVPFLEEVAGRWTDRAVLLTGDGGDKVFPDLRPLRRPRTIGQAAAAIVEEAEAMAASDVESIVGLPAGTLMDDLRRRLAAYPEVAPEHKAARFQIAERARKWLFEGEDRTRFFLWAASPFYALPVFEAALAVPDRRKVDYRFYAAVQRHLNPVLLEIPHADFGLSIESVRFRARAIARRWTLRALRSVRSSAGEPGAGAPCRPDDPDRCRDGDPAHARGAGIGRFAAPRADPARRSAADPRGGVGAGDPGLADGAPGRRAVERADRARG